MLKTLPYHIWKVQQQESNGRGLCYDIIELITSTLDNVESFAIPYLKGATIDI